eukprot:SAG11_NODE_680_length_7781_cov_6.490497_8_plen_52_part_00
MPRVTAKEDSGHDEDPGTARQAFAQLPSLCILVATCMSKLWEHLRPAQFMR